MEVDRSVSPEPRSPGLKKEFLERNKKERKKLSLALTRGERIKEERLNFGKRFTEA